MNMNKYIDHTLLKQDATQAQIETLCEEAKQYDFKCVCVNPGFVSTSKELLKDSDVLVCTVIGFPLGASTTATKVFETKDAITNGADEIDMVINVSNLKDKKYDVIEQEIKAIKDACGTRTLKVILETCLLSDEEIVKACELSVAAGANFVKTSTGFSTGGATAHHVALMKKTVGNKAEVKASGGIRSKDDFDTLVEAGATRIGASSGVLLMQGQASTDDY
ncbi:MAG: deoxyribose-phosphate aldolase [Erysipelothrix sp.]|nr:deoxyribose-phosphate aldolase [Erysipelothrix sp.]